MAYCTIDDITASVSEAELARLTNDTDPSTVSTTVVDAAIAQADATIDAWIGGRYSVPLASVPKIVTGISADIAIWMIFSRRDVTELPEGRKTRYQSAIEILKAIAAGKIPLEATGQTSATTARIKTAAPTATFTTDVWSKY